MAFGEPEVYKDDEKLLELVFRAWESSRDALKPLRETKWRRDYLFYHSCHDLSMFKRARARIKDDYPYESSLFIPTALQQVETLTPRLCQSLLANDPLFRVKPMPTEQELEDPGERATMDQDARAVEVLIHNQFIRDVRVNYYLPMWVRDALIYGTKWLFVEWFSRRGTKWGMKSGRTRKGYPKPEWKFEKGESDSLLEDRVKVSGLTGWSVYPDPVAQAIHSDGTTLGCRYVQRVVLMPVDMLWGHIQATPQKEWKIKKRADLERFMGQVEDGDNMHRELQAEVAKLSKDRGQGWRPTDEDKRLVRLTDHWEDADGYHVLALGKKGGENGVALVEENPHKVLGIPFVSIRPTPLDNELFGMGLIDMIEQLVHHINALTNLRLTNIVRATNPILLVDTTSGVTSDDLISQPGAVLDTDGSVPLDQTVCMIDYKPVDNTAYKEIDFAMQQAQLSTGATNMSMGDPAQGFNQTARGIGYLLEQGNARFNLQAHSVGTSMCRLGEAVHAMNQQYITKSRIERVTGHTGENEFVPVDPDMIRRPIQLYFDCRPEAANKGLQAQQFINFAQVFGEWPEFARSQAILEGGKLFGVSEPRRFLTQQESHPALENEIFRQTGEMPPVSPTDNHEFHLSINQQVQVDGSVLQWGEQGEQVVLEHLQQHLEYGRLMTAPGPGQGAPQGGPAGGGGEMPAQGAAGGGPELVPMEGG